MPQFPTLTPAGTTNVDAGGDEPRLARADIKNNIDNVNSIISTYDGKELADTATEQDWTRQQYFALATLTDASTINWNAQTQQVAQVTLSGSRLITISNHQAGATYVLIVRQDGSGGRSLSWSSEFLWSLGATPTLTQSTNAVDVFTFISDGTYLYGSIARNFS